MPSLVGLLFYVLLAGLLVICVWMTDLLWTFHRDFGLGELVGRGSGRE